MKSERGEVPGGNKRASQQSLAGRPVTAAPEPQSTWPAPDSTAPPLSHTPTLVSLFTLHSSLFLGLLAAVPFILPGFPAARDSQSHLFRVWAFDRAILGGDLVPRWLPDFVFGYGYPLFNYYGPLLYYLTEPFRMLGADVMVALRLTIVGAMLVAALGAYLLGRQWFGPAGGLITAAAYVAAPYLQTDLIVRGAFPEALGMAILPIALWLIGAGSGLPAPIAVSAFWERIGANWRAVLAALALAALILSHNAAALLGLPVALAWALWIGIHQRDAERAEDNQNRDSDGAAARVPARPDQNRDSDGAAAQVPARPDQNRDSHGAAGRAVPRLRHSGSFGQAAARLLSRFRSGPAHPGPSREGDRAGAAGETRVVEVDRLPAGIGTDERSSGGNPRSITVAARIPDAAPNDTTPATVSGDQPVQGDQPVAPTQPLTQIQPSAFSLQPSNTHPSTFNPKPSTPIPPSLSLFTLHSSPFLLSLLLSAFFWLPAVGELGAVALGASDAGATFLASLARPEALVQWNVIHDYREVPGQFLPAGLVQIVAAIAGLPFALRRAGGRFFALLALVCLLLMTTWSAPIWERLPLASLMAFPWRLQAILALATAVLAGGIAVRPLLAVLAVPALLIAGLAGVAPGRLDIHPDQIAGAGFSLFERQSNFIGTTSPVQFLPRTVQTDPARLPGDGPFRNVVPLPEISQFDSTGTSYRFRTRSSEPAPVRLRTFAFPGWTATIDGAPAPIQPDGPDGLIRIDLPAGDYEVAIRFGDTPLRTAGTALSLLGLLILAATVIGSIRSHPLNPLPKSADRNPLPALHPTILPSKSASLSAQSVQSGLRNPLTALLMLLTVLLVAGMTRERPRFVPANADLGPVRLLGARVEVAGSRVEVRPVWQVRAPLDESDRVVLRLFDASGAIVAEESRPPRFGTVSAARWAPGDLVDDFAAVSLAPGAAAGTGRIEIGWRSGAGVRLADLGAVTIPASPGSATRPAIAVSPDRIQLLDASVARLHPAPFGIALPAGDWPTALDVRLTWQTDRPRYDDLLTFVHLTDGRTTIAQADSYPPLDLRNSTLWQPGRPVDQRFRLAVPPAPPGRYRVVAGLASALGRVPFGDARSEIVIGELRQQAPAPANRVERAIGPIRLLGYETIDRCETAGCRLRFRLVWQADRTPGEDLTVFVHLIGPGGLVAQADGPPAEGSDPTGGWLPGDRISDERTMAIPANLPAGRYQILIGLYRPTDGVRLPLEGGGDSLPLFDLDLRR